MRSESGQAWATFRRGTTKRKGKVLPGWYAIIRRKFGFLTFVTHRTQVFADGRRVRVGEGRRSARRRVEDAARQALAASDATHCHS